MLRIGDEAFHDLAAIEDAEELCRRLLASPWGWGRSTGHIEAIELLANVQGTSELPAAFIALMVCTCQRWDRVTARLIAALDDSALLDDTELDELAESFLSHEHVISYPLTWVSPQWVEVDLDVGAGRTYTVNEGTLAQHRPTVEPPLRRWAANRALRSNTARLEELLRGGDLFEPRHRDALIHGLLDAADVLDEPARRGLIERGLNTAHASVRRTALDHLCELDGPETALHRARTTRTPPCANGNRPYRSSPSPPSYDDGPPAPTRDQQRRA
jgi:hypothetical protein